MLAVCPVYFARKQPHYPLSLTTHYSLVHVVDVLHHLYDGKHLFLY
jgi:hypothetical protein